jgi:hypothetical protein
VMTLIAGNLQRSDEEPGLLSETTTSSRYMPLHNSSLR